MRPLRTSLRVKWGMVVSGVFLVFFLQGCTEPFVKVDVKVGDCPSGEINGVGLCSSTTVQSQTTFTNAMNQQVTCAAGSQKCQVEGTTVGCRSGKKCTTVDMGSNNCVCKCQP